MRGLLVRVAADQSDGGGNWNGPVDSATGEFAYIAIPEGARSHPHLVKPYSLTKSALAKFAWSLPGHLALDNMHLDPDFEYLTYGDQGERAKQIQNKLGSGDVIAFYAGLRDVSGAAPLVYAIIGLFIIDEIVSAITIPVERWPENAHTRRVLAATANDIVVRARPVVSGRLQRCLAIGDYRQRAYRVWPDTLALWGGLSVNNGYLQRSARLPEFLDAEKFYSLFLGQNIPVVQRNN